MGALESKCGCKHELLFSRKHNERARNSREILEASFSTVKCSKEPVETRKCRFASAKMEEIAIGCVEFHDIAQICRLRRSKYFDSEVGNSECNRQPVSGSAQAQNNQYNCFQLKCGSC